MPGLVRATTMVVAAATATACGHEGQWTHVYTHACHEARGRVGTVGDRGETQAIICRHAVRAAGLPAQQPSGLCDGECLLHKPAAHHGALCTTDALQKGALDDERERMAGYKPKGKRWDARKRKYRPVTWARAHCIFYQGLRGATFRANGPYVLTAMVVKHGDMGITKEEQEERQYQLTEDMASAFSRDYLVDPMQIQRITLWKGCWSLNKGVAEGETTVRATRAARACPLTWPTRTIVGCC